MNNLTTHPPPGTWNARNLLTVHEVAEWARVHPKTVYRWIKEGKMDEYPKAALLALLSSVLYFDGVVRRRESLAGGKFPPMQIFFEEANKVLTGVSGAAADQNVSAGSAEQVSEVFQTFWRDGRKYQIFLHLIAQTVSALPAGILSSCNNGFFFQLK